MNRSKPGILVSTLLLLISIYTQGAENDSIQHQLEIQIADAAGDSLKLIEGYFDYGEYFVAEGKIEYSIKQFEKIVIFWNYRKNSSRV